MTVFKKLFTATLIVLIILSIAGIIYVVQFQEELPEKEQAKKVTKKIVVPKVDTSRASKARPVAARKVA